MAELFFDVEKLAVAARQASLDAREELLKKGISVVYSRNGRLIRELPNGRKIVVGRLNGTHRFRAAGKV